MSGLDNVMLLNDGNLWSPPAVPAIFKKNSTKKPTNVTPVTKKTTSTSSLTTVPASSIAQYYTDVGKAMASASNTADTTRSTKSPTPASTPTPVPKPVPATSPDEYKMIQNDLRQALQNIIYPDAPTARSGKDMAEHLGVIYDRDTFEQLLRDAITAQYANLDTEFARTQRSYYDMIGNTADALLGTMRRGDRDAVRSGTTTGAQMAQQLSALLGVSQEQSQGATELAQLRADLVHQREAALAEAAEKATKMYNDLGQALGQLAMSELGHKAVIHSGEVASKAGLEAAIRQLLSQNMQHMYGLDNNINVANIQAQAALAQAAAQKYAAELGLQGQMYGADQQRIAQELVTGASNQQALMNLLAGMASGNKKLTQQQNALVDSLMKELGLKLQ